ncbi:MAG: hypothetical protein E5Y88_11515 [Mesorhizobium sp.]|uniref:hypothetical protein n=1 Tax=Mesorhizobium sp. TaxID=1871066 RepID=UPI000FE8B34F|nr:hypothetical protein [Mesorhizobium sp.]RWQ36267.1 MAG: hypothetical protein EOS20_15885 [Mesorhizobium sp.]TIL25581.1 MAG: hypothetical protein E5Y88_11515 [Mesorhizobium sp.]
MNINAILPQSQLIVSQAQQLAARLIKHTARYCRAWSTSFWWDTSIDEAIYTGGAAPSDDVARVLDSAGLDGVVWSTVSIGAAWARYETSASRDRKRLAQG